VLYAALIKAHPKAAACSSFLRSLQVREWLHKYPTVPRSSSSPQGLVRGTPQEEEEEEVEGEEGEEEQRGSSEGTLKNMSWEGKLEDETANLLQGRLAVFSARPVQNMHWPRYWLINEVQRPTPVLDCKKS